MNRLTLAARGQCDAVERGEVILCRCMRDVVVRWESGNTHVVVKRDPLMRAIRVGPASARSSTDRAGDPTSTAHQNAPRWYAEFLP